MAKLLRPLGAFYSLIGRCAPARIQIDQAREKQGKPCGLCVYHCPMRIEALENHIKKGKRAVDDPDCTRCGSCMDGCPRDSLRIGIAPRAPQTGKQKPG